MTAGFPQPAALPPPTADDWAIYHEFLALVPLIFGDVVPTEAPSFRARSGQPGAGKSFTAALEENGSDVYADADLFKAAYPEYREACEQGRRAEADSIFQPKAEAMQRMAMAWAAGAPPEVVATANTWLRDPGQSRAAMEATAAALAAGDGQQFNLARHGVPLAEDEFTAEMSFFRGVGFESRIAYHAVPAALSRLRLTARYFREGYETQGHGLYCAPEIHDWCFDRIPECARWADRLGIETEVAGPYGEIVDPIGSDTGELVEQERGRDLTESELVEFVNLYKTVERRLTPPDRAKSQDELKEIVGLLPPASRAEVLSRLALPEPAVTASGADTGRVVQASSVPERPTSTTPGVKK